MVVLIDTNILIDYLTSREPYYDNAALIVKQCAAKKIEGYMAFHSLPNIWYILRKLAPDNMRRQWLKELCAIIKVTGASHDDIVSAIENQFFTDFEDCLQDCCAAAVHADYIITRNIQDFSHSVIPAISPEDFLSQTD